MGYEKEQVETIVVGDFNSHSIRWNCQKTDQNGMILSEEMDEENMYVINEDTLSRMGERREMAANLDLIFGSRGIIDKICARRGARTISQLKQHVHLDMKEVGMLRELTESPQK